VPVSQHLTQNDSVAATQQEATFYTHGQITRTWGGLSPYQVLGKLPLDASEQQRDSAIRAAFRPGVTHYNNRIDTLKTFGVQIKKRKRLSEMDYRDLDMNYSKDTLYQANISMGHKGVLGDPAPYSVSSDNTITGLLIGCFILAMIALAHSWNFLVRQLKYFFYMPRNVANITETSNEIRFQMFLVFVTALLISILFYFYSTHFMDGEYIMESQLAVIGIYLGIVTAYFTAKTILYSIVNGVFFNSKNNEQWWKTFLFLQSIEGVLLFPIVLLQVYLDISTLITLIYTISVLVFVKILTFYKCYAIFFKRIERFLLFILYFCALEVIPVLSLWGILMITGNYLKIKL
jgi:hypothetical protein